MGEFSEEQLIQNEPAVITITKTGYVKRQAPSTFKTQARGGKGVIGMTTKEEDTIDHLVSANTHDNILFFTNRGKVYQVRVWDIPEGTRISKGQAIVNIINTEQGEMVNSILTYAAKPKDRGSAAYIVMATRKGTVKKTKISEYEKIRRNGLVAIKLEKGDELRWAKLSSGKDEILMVTHNGKSIRFPESEVRHTARDTMGVRGILGAGDDYVVGMGVLNEENKSDNFLTIMERGIGKQTPLPGFPKQHRGGQGVKVAIVTAKTGKVVVAQIVPKDCQTIILTSIKGQIVKLPITSVPKLSRATQGVILMRFSDKGDSIAAATCLS